MGLWDFSGQASLFAKALYASGVEATFLGNWRAAGEKRTSNGELAARGCRDLHGHKRLYKWLPAMVAKGSLHIQKVSTSENKGQAALATSEKDIRPSLPFLSNSLATGKK